MSNVLHSSRFTWIKGRGSAEICDLGLASFPNSFVMRSARTGVERTFYRDDAVMEAHEFFDGEAMAYCDATGVTKVRIHC